MVGFAQVSNETHALPAGTLQLSCGSELDGFDGEVVVGGPSALSIGNEIHVLAEISLELIGLRRVMVLERL